MSGLPGALAVSVGGSLFANWIDRHGLSKVSALLKGPLSLPRHDDMVRVADLALFRALTTLLKEMKTDAKAAGGAGDDFLNGLSRLTDQAKSHTTRLNPADANDAVAVAMTHLSGQHPAQALTRLLHDAIAPDIRAAGDGEYQAAWRGLSDKLHADLPDLLAAYVAEALKTDERFFRAVTLTLQSAMAATGDDVLAAVQQQGAALADLQKQLQAHLAQLPAPPGLEEFTAALDQGLAELKSAIKVELEAGRAPPLTWSEPSEKAGQDISLLYYDRKARFVGRDAAMAALNLFLDDPAPLLWTTITGGAGVGKSRLVLEALSLRRLAGGVDAGFMKPSDGWLTAKRYENWRAPVPTVLIIDYAGVSPELVRDLVHDLACRTAGRTLRAPVRLLLLDTQPNQGDFALANRIKNRTNAGELAQRVEWDDPARAALDLSSLSPDDLFSITALYRNAALTVAEKGRIAAAVQTDPELARPLFAALMGLALRYGTDAPLTLAGVTSHFLDRQEAHWAERDQITALDRTLLALATLGGSVPLAPLLKQPLLKDLLPTSGKADRPTLKQHWSVMTGKPLPADHLTKLEPDYVGGLYLLRHLKQAAPGDTREPDEVAAEVERLITLAWERGDPREPLVNLARNFAGSAEWVELVTDLALYRPQGEMELRWAEMVPDLAFAMAQRETDVEVDHVDRILTVLEAGDSPLDKAMLALACFSSGLAGELGKHDRADVRLKRLQRLVSNNPGNADIALPLANGLVNAVAVAGTDTARADALLDELRALANGHTGNADIALPLAKGLFNAFNDAGPDTARANALLDELRTLADKHTGNADIALRLANGLVNAVADAGPDTARADGLLGELRTLADTHTGNADIALPLANGLFNAFNGAGPGTARADGLLGELRALADTHMGNADIALQLANGLFNAAAYAEPDTARADGLLDELRALANDHTDSADIALQLAKGLCLTLYRGHGDDANLLEGLSALAAVHPGGKMIQQAFTVALRLIAERQAEQGADTGRADRVGGEAV